MGKKFEMKTREQEKQYRRQAGVKELLNGDFQVQSFLQVSVPTTTGAQFIVGAHPSFQFPNKTQPCFPYDGHKDSLPSKHSYVKSPSPFQEGTAMGWPRQVPGQGQPRGWPQTPVQPPGSRAVGGLCNVSELCFVLLSNHFFWLHLFLVSP